MKIKYIITGLALAAALTVVACESVPPQQVIVAKADLKENVITAPGPQQQAAPIVIEAVSLEDYLIWLKNKVNFINKNKLLWILINRYIFAY